MRWPWHLRRELDERASEARAEAEKSRRALAETREKIIGPAASLRDRNHFAEVIRASLLEGRNGSGQ
jgi:hypothetical protein